ncbi:MULTISPECIES: type II secretion system F family protein [Nocardiopsis]|uniref:Flp pilus assembly protein TadB n=3 Tax=Nocardiopsis TaxID=2013 RepID=A0A840W8A7_9ACTN|nr:Flp pilus assembly protein TadB [Nocardiopsis metallicus]
MSIMMLGLAGSMLGAGVCAGAYALRRPTLTERLTPRPEPEPRTVPRGSWIRRVGHRSGSLLAHVGLPGPVMARTLAAAGTSVEDYRAEKAASTGLGLLLAVVLFAVGDVLPQGLPVGLLALLVLAGCVLAPDLAARGAAVRQRGELRAATSALADLVVMGLAAGAGATGALTTALQHGKGTAPERIRKAVHSATVRHRPPWEGLEALAVESGVRELSELAASLRLGGASGARTRTSLTAKATSLRARRLAEVEATALAATERMALPTMGLVSGFLLLIVYVALVHVMAGF